MINCMTLELVYMYHKVLTNYPWVISACLEIQGGGHLHENFRKHCLISAQ